MRSAAGLAELEQVSIGPNIRNAGTYFAMAWLVESRIVASSLIRCGRFPVLSSCSITEMTTSSLIPSRSIFLYVVTSPGEGGGVCATARRCGCRAFKSVEGVRLGEGICGGLSCSRFTRFAGGELSCVCSEDNDFEFER